MFRIIPWTYLAMMLMTGLLIGIVAALSKTSVTNTLVQSVLVFIAGSAGLYFLNQKVLQKEQLALRAIGTTGLIFLFSLLCGYTGARAIAGPASYQWHQQFSPSKNLALAEIRGHFHQLGISWNNQLAEQLDKMESTLPPSATRSCLQGNWNDVEYAENLRKIYEHKAVCLASKLRPDWHELTAIAEIGNDAKSTFVTQKNAEIGRQKLEYGSAALINLANIYPHVSNPVAPGCKKTNEVTQAAARLFAERIERCQGSNLTRILYLSRLHGRAFGNAWDGKKIEPFHSKLALESRTIN